MNHKEVQLYVSGTHCPSCKIFIEDELHEVDGISSVVVDLASKTVTLKSSREMSDKELAEFLTQKIEHNGYVLRVEPLAPQDSGAKDLWVVLPLGLSLLALFVMVQKTGILNLGFGGTVTPLTSFLIGLVASVSSCLAVVGGLVLSLSATVSQDAASDKKAMILFHGGRLVAFALLGGALGALGSVVGVSFTLSAVLGVIASVVMILLGLNLVGVFQKQLVTLSPRVFNFFRSAENTIIGPMLLGVGTFFLPCGFTQAMQVTALSSGSFVSGLLIMLAFSLGTLPMLALLSFGASSFAQTKYSKLFFKVSGVVVIGFGVFSLLAGLAGMGIIQPLFTL
ncbi:sulfite exporter TauE/SafE family protein [Candidatus Falkowbacteria bacterium]|nr:sulfite exporter TauE/SafE family protein [Candidatus Falkowbacteria bacterium]